MVKRRIWHFLERYAELVGSKPRQELLSKQGLAWLETIPVNEHGREVSASWNRLPEGE